MKKHKELFLGLIPILLVVALTVGLSELFYQRMVDRATQSCWEELDMAHHEASREISIRLNNNMKMLKLATDGIMLNTDLTDEKAVCDYLRDVKEETIFDRVEIMFPDGRILMDNGQWAEGADEETARELVRNGLHLSLRKPDFDTGYEAVHAAAPVYDNSGNAVAVLGATVYCPTLTEQFTSAHYGEQAQLFLVDLRDGALIVDGYHETPGSIYDMQRYGEQEGRDFVAEIMAGKSGTLSYLSQTYGDTAYTIYGPVENTEYALIMVLQEDVIFAAVEAQKASMAWVGFGEVVVLILFVLWTYFNMRRSVKNEIRAKQAEFALLEQKEQELENQYAAAANRQAFLEVMAINLPGGYHRCTTDHEFRLTFISNSFTQVTGYTMEQLEEELDCSYMGIVAPEDREYFMSLAPQLERDGFIHCAYRIRRRDGTLRWVKDTTQYVERDGEAYYQCALMDTSEQIEEIQRARQAAEASSQAKSTFLFNISHDIRTPMNAIKGFAHIIEENAQDPQRVLDAVRKINQAGDSLMMLMNDVLDIARIERGKEELSLQPLDLYAHGKHLYEMFAADMRDAGIRFLVEGEEIREQLYCDELKLTRIIMNMLSNAKKFTPAGGTVAFGVDRLARGERSCTYRFFVRDTGIGMSEAFQRRAFEQFERERTSTESGVAGSGLGLSIIKMLAELMGGTVDIRSQLGKGTEISVTLTLMLADVEDKGQPQEKRAAMDLTGKRVLMVEDNEFNREIGKYVLEGMGLAVEVAENGALCLEKLLSAGPGHYDLVLMDIQMPVMDGYTATEKIRELEDHRLAAIPIVAMTANAFEEDKRKCLNVGMNGHVGKPIDVNDLMQVLSQVLS